jgi:BirA family biotin operon repressor/biotin-[acetyl-CoA-carboxylase] ligase
MMLALIRLLQDGRFHSGEEIGAVLGVTRSAVWKQLQRLQVEYGIDVHKVRGRGYRLADRLQLLDHGGDFQGRHCSWKCSAELTVDSTNAEALRRMQQGTPVPFAVVAERQTSGRGRRGRVWSSPFGENLYYSLVLRIDRGVRQLDGLSLVVGLAVLRTVQLFGVKGAGLKWPNDVLVGDRKLAGILLELAGDPGDICHVVIGAGINVNMRHSAAEITQPWTSVVLETGILCDRNELLGVFQAQLESYLHQHAVAGFAALRDEWESCHLWQMRTVELAAGSIPVIGTVMGVDNSGALRMEVDGAERIFSGGEISLRLSNDS